MPSSVGMTEAFFEKSKQTLNSNCFPIFAE